jgi:hypothetical protein
MGATVLGQLNRRDLKLGKLALYRLSYRCVYAIVADPKRQISALRKLNSIAARTRTEVV